MWIGIRATSHEVPKPLITKIVLKIYLSKLHLNLTRAQVTATYFYSKYRRTSNISCSLTGNKIVGHPDVEGAVPVGAASTTSSFST